MSSHPKPHDTHSHQQVSHAGMHPFLLLFLCFNKEGGGGGGGGGEGEEEEEEEVEGEGEGEGE